MCNTAAPSAAPLLFILLLLLLLLCVNDARAIVCSYKGERHADGDRWVVRSTFVMECHVFPDGSWRADIVACQTPKGMEIHDGDEVVEDGIRMQCSKLPTGAYRIQRHYIIRNISCEGRAVGDWWINNRNFNKTCTPTGTRITNCLTDAGIPFALNSSIALSGIKYNCVDQGNGTVTLMREYSRIPGTFSGSKYCTVNGTRKRPGETWIEGANFMKKCDERGAIVIEACVADGSAIDLNSNVTRNGKTYSCTRTTDGTVLFKVMPVSAKGTRL